MSFTLFPHKREKKIRKENKKRKKKQITFYWRLHSSRILGQPHKNATRNATTATFWTVYRQDCCSYSSNAEARSISMPFSNKHCATEASPSSRQCLSRIHWRSEAGQRVSRWEAGRVFQRIICTHTKTVEAHASRTRTVGATTERSAMWELIFWNVGVKITSKEANLS